MQTIHIYLCPLSFWLTLPQRVLSTSWCCPSRLCVVFLACVHLPLYLALSLSPGNFLVSSWCDHSMLASLLWRCLSVSFTPALLRTHSFVSYAVSKWEETNYYYDIIWSAECINAFKRLFKFFLFSVSYPGLSFSVAACSASSLY